MKFHVFRGTLLAAAALLFAQMSGAQSWQMVGPRAMGMGGAGVATTYGPNAQYWNPAGLARDTGRSNTGLSIAVSMEATKNVLENLRDLNDMSAQYKSLRNDIINNQKVSGNDIRTIFRGLNHIARVIGDDMGAILNAEAGISAKMKNFYVGARSLGTGSIFPIVDTKNIQFNTAGAGLLLGDPFATLTTSNQIAADDLAAAIDEYGIFEALKQLFDATSCDDSNQLAVALVDAAASFGASEMDIWVAIHEAIDNMDGASNILTRYAQATGSYKDNETLVIAEGAAFTEIGLGYGTEVFPGVKVGGNVKVISGYTAQSGIMVLQDHDEIKDILNRTRHNKKNTTNLGLDVGALVNLSQLLDKEIKGNPQLGLTARNINGPKFSRPGAPVGTNPAIVDNWRSGSYQLKPQLRAGAAVSPFTWMTAAADIDVTKNDTLVYSLKSRQLALGVEFNLVNGQRFQVPLRLGYNKNIAESEVSPFYTAGIGLNMRHFYVELAGAMSRKTTRVDGHTIPNSAAASLTLGFLL